MQYQWQGLLLLSVIPIFIIVATLFIQASRRRIFSSAETSAERSG